MEKAEHSCQLSLLSPSCQAAYELEPATLSMCQRAIPWAPSPHAAAQFLRSAWLDAIRAHRQAHAAGAAVSRVLDVGCSAGISTRYLADAFPAAQVTVSGWVSGWVGG